jgi:hypothetical protein
LHEHRADQPDGEERGQEAEADACALIERGVAAFLDAGPDPVPDDEAGRLAYREEHEHHGERDERGGEVTVGEPAGHLRAHHDAQDEAQEASPELEDEAEEASAPTAQRGKRGEDDDYEINGVHPDPVM